MTGNLRLRGEGGAATLELALVTPILLTMIMLLVQFGLWYHATNVASAAAQEGARACRIESGTEAAGEAAASALIATAAGTLFTSVPVVECVRGADTARMEVTGSVVQVLPIQIVTLPPIVEVSEGPVERFRTDTGGP